MQSISSGREAHICFQGRHITISDVSLEICNNYRTDIVLDDYGSQIASLPAGGGLDLELRGQVTDISTNEVGIVNPALSHTSDEMPVYPSGIDSSSNLVARIFGFLDIAVPPATEKQTEDETNKRAERLLISHLDPE